MIRKRMLSWMLAGVLAAGSMFSVQAADLTMHERRAETEFAGTQQEHDAGQKKEYAAQSEKAEVSETEKETEKRKETEKETAAQTEKEEICEEEGRDRVSADTSITEETTESTEETEANRTQDKIAAEEQDVLQEEMTPFAAAVDYIECHGTGRLLNDGFDKNYNKTDEKRNACILNGGPARTDYTQFQNSLAAVAEDPFNGIQGVRISKKRGEYKKDALMTAIYANKLYYYNGETYVYGDIRLTVVDYYRDNLGNGNAFFAFSPRRPGVFTYGLEWVEVKCEFLLHGTATPVYVSGYTVYKDIDLNQGIVFSEGNVTGGYGYQNSRIKKTMAGSYMYYYSSNPEGITPEDTEGWLGVNFDGTSFQTIYTFCKKNQKGNQVKSSGAMGMTYAGCYIPRNEGTLRKYAGAGGESPNTASLSTEKHEVSGYQERYWYRLKLDIPPKIADFYSSVSVLDGIPPWLNVISCNSVKNGAGTELMGDVWTYTLNGNVLTYTARKLQDVSFYDRSYYFDICVEVKDKALFREAGVPAYDETTERYYWTNWAVAKFNGVSLDSNHVVTYMPKPASMPWIMVEKIDRQSGKAITSGDAEFELLEKTASGSYRHYDTLQWDAESGYYKSSKQARQTEENQGIFKIKETVPPAGYLLNERWEKIFDLKEYPAEQECILFEKEQACPDDKNSVIIWKLSQTAHGETVQKPISGVKFKIEGPEGYTVEKSTDAEGKILLEKLPAGIYCYRELAGADGYVMHETEYQFEIQCNGDCVSKNEEIKRTGTFGKRTLTVLNEPIQLAVQKKDKQSGQPLEGAKLRLETEDGVLVREFVSGSEPEYFARLKTGKYVLKETEAPEGYIKAKPVAFALKEVSGIQEVCMYDLPCAVVQVTKKVRKDEVLWEHGRPIFVFELKGTDFEGKMHTYYETAEFTQESREQDGFYEEICVFAHIPAGRYTLTEKNVLGYFLEDVTTADRNVEISRLAEPQYGFSPSELFEIQIDVTQKREAALVMTNRKQTYDDYRHTDCIVNEILVRSPNEKRDQG